MDDHELLSRLTIVTPCPMDWDQMTGDDRARYCAACGKHVHDFARMTAAEASDLLRDADGHLDVCGRIARHPDGTLVTADFPVAAEPALASASASASSSSPPRWQYHIRSLMGLIAGVAATLGISRLFAEDPSQPPRTATAPLVRRYMGEVALRPIPSPTAPAVSRPSNPRSACPAP